VGRFRRAQRSEIGHQVDSWPSFISENWHDGAAVAADEAGAVDQDRVGIRDGFREVLCRVLSTHARQLRAGRGRLTGRQRKLLALDRVARVALELDEDLTPGGSVARRDGEAPARRDTAGGVERVHGHPDRGRRRKCALGLTMAGVALSVSRRRDRGSKEEEPTEEKKLPVVGHDCRPLS
jgi:hypothetical protein